MKKRYKSAPLPFQGQKRMFIKEFKETLEDIKNSNQEIKIIVDLFGGSGLLSHTAKRTIPKCRVIYNDYDNFSQRIKNIAQTNKLLSKIRELTKGVSTGSKIPIEIKNKIIALIKLEEEHSYVDFITVSSSILFSGNYVLNLDQLKKESLYNNVKINNYDLSGEYLDGLEIERKDYLELFNEYKNKEGVLFIIDPPYLATNIKTYQNCNYWTLKEYLDILLLLSDSKYIYFTSKKSSLVELSEWIEKNNCLNKPLLPTSYKTRVNSVSYNGSYTDIMFFIY